MLFLAFPCFSSFCGAQRAMNGSHRRNCHRSQAITRQTFPHDTRQSRYHTHRAILPYPIVYVSSLGINRFCRRHFPGFTPRRLLFWLGSRGFASFSFFIEEQGFSLSQRSGITKPSIVITTSGRLWYSLSMEHAVFSRALRYILCNFLYRFREHYLVQPICDLQSRNS